MATYRRFFLQCFPFLMSLVLAKRVVDWVPLDGDVKNGLARFDKTDYSFPVVDNLVYCRKNIITLPHDPTINDYGPIIDEKLAKLNAMGGGTLRFDAATYMIQSQFHMPSYTCIQGKGMHSTILKVHPEAPPFPKAGMIRTVYTKRVSILDLTQDGNRHNLPGEPQNRFGVYTHLANFVWMKNVRILNNKWYGFDPHGANTAWSYYLVMEDCYSEGNGKDGYTIDQYYFVSMLNSVARNNDRHGINVVSGAQYVLVKNNLLQDNAMCSIVVQNNEFGTHSVRFIGNIGVGHGLAGICIRNTMDIQAFRNKMYSKTAGVSMYQLHNTMDTILADNEWVRTAESGKLFTGYGDNLYDVVRNTDLVANTKINARYNAYFVAAEKPHPLVNLRRNNYGIKPANNQVPNIPKRLTFRTNKNIKELIARKRTHKQFVDPKSNNPIGSDAKCDNGIRNGLYCCPQKCGKCVPDNCASMGAECCPDSIRLDASSCDTFGAPCLMSRKYTARGRLFGPEKLRKDGIFPENGDVKTPGGPQTDPPAQKRPKVQPNPVVVQTTPQPKPVRVEPTPEPKQTNIQPTPESNPIGPVKVEPTPAHKPVMPHPAPEQQRPTKEKPAPVQMEPKPVKVDPTPKPKRGASKDDDDDDDDEKKSSGPMKRLIPRKGAAASTENTTKREADPDCKNGVSNKRICCPSSCGTCGGRGCSKRDGGRMCCQKHVRATGRLCKNNVAPCIKML